MVRLLFGLPFAALVTGVLFVVMYGFVKPGEVVVGTPTEPPNIQIFADIDESEPKPREVKIEKLDRAPPPPKILAPRPSDADRPVVTAARPTVEPVSPYDFPAQTTLQPVATLAPQFPGRCQASGTEGYAVVRYDVTANGQVVNARVIERSHQCFELAALRAIRGWRYQPAVGRSGTIATGLTRRFTFELDEA